jgi:hypothetical protein
MAEAVAGAVVGNVVNRALGGGGGGTAPSQAPVTVPGAEFQPFTYRGTGGFDVTGSQVGDDGYSWSANIPDWVKGLGDIGAGAAGGLFQDYLTAAQQDPYAAADEYYQRGLAQLQPELAKQQIAAQERMFGSGRLGLKLAGAGVGAPTGTGAVSPDAYGLAAGQASMLQDLYTKSLSAGQQMQTNRLNQLSDAASKMLELGMKPNEIEQELINFGADLETARSTALKAGTSFVPLKETRESVLNAQLANTLGGAANNYVKTGMDTGNWSLFGGSGGGTWGSPSMGQMYNNYAATGSLGGNFGFGTGNSLMTNPTPVGFIP